MAGVTLRDGTRMVYDEHDFTNPWRESEPVVLVHGFSKNRRFWYPWVPALARRYRVIRPDLRGHGESDLPAPDFQMSLAPFAADLDEFLDRLGLTSAHFVAAEFSTAVAIEFAVSYPKRLRTLTLAGLTYNTRSAPVDFEAWARQIEREGSEAWARATNHLRLPADADPGLKEWYIEQQGRMPRWLMAAVMRYVSTVDLTEKLSRIEAPTLILAGEAGQQESFENVRRAAQLIPNAELVVLKGAPLNVMNARPDECMAATLAFLERHVRGERN